jgi:hypothetical protein
MVFIYNVFRSIDNCVACSSTQEDSFLHLEGTVSSGIQNKSAVGSVLEWRAMPQKHAHVSCRIISKPSVMSADFLFSAPVSLVASARQTQLPAMHHE